MDNSISQPVVSGFGEVLLFSIGGLIFVVLTMLVSRLVRPNRPNVEKLATYESGEEAVGSAWMQFNIRFYILALIFILFEAELIFLFPWSTVFGSRELVKQTNGLWAWTALIEMILFVLILVLGLAYAWAHGYLDWVKPRQQPEEYQSVVPKDLYDKINQKYS